MAGLSNYDEGLDAGRTNAAYLHPYCSSPIEFPDLTSNSTIPRPMSGDGTREAPPSSSELKIEINPELNAIYRWEVIEKAKEGSQNTGLTENAGLTGPMLSSTEKENNDEFPPIEGTTETALTECINLLEKVKKSFGSLSIDEKIEIQEAPQWLQLCPTIRLAIEEGCRWASEQDQQNYVPQPCTIELLSHDRMTRNTISTLDAKCKELKEEYDRLETFFAECLRRNTWQADEISRLRNLQPGSCLYCDHLNQHHTYHRNMTDAKMVQTRMELSQQKISACSLKKKESQSDKKIKELEGKVRALEKELENPRKECNLALKNQKAHHEEFKNDLRKKNDELKDRIIELERLHGAADTISNNDGIGLPASPPPEEAVVAQLAEGKSNDRNA